MSRRTIYLDWLRVLATVAVVTIHIAYETLAVNLFDQPLSNWLAGNFFDSAARFAVPVFVMISGALLLNDKRDLTYKSFFQKRFSKVFIPFICWSIVYYFYEVYQGNYHFSMSELTQLISTNGISIHLWYMYMIVGMYLITPLLKVFIKNASKKDIGYFILLWLSFSVLLRLLNQYAGFSFYVQLNYVTNYIGYFILGYYLSHFDIPVKWRKLSYIGAIMGAVSTFVLTYLVTIRAEGVFYEFWYEDQAPNVLLMAVGLFIFFKYSVVNNNSRLPYVAARINEASFGIYLIHILVIKIFYESIFTNILAKFHAMIAIPVNVIIVVSISMILVYLLKKLPFAKKLVP